jgi:hypothetical protein
MPGRHKAAPAGFPERIVGPDRKMIFFAWIY